jgi:hypothetical protein
MPRNKCPWFEPTQKPVRPGVYSVKVTLRGRPFYRHWDGKDWGRVSITIEIANTNRAPRLGFYGTLPWRGLLR